MTQTATEYTSSDHLASQVFELPPLPYETGDLAPVLSSETLEVHHGRHHARYVETLNRLLREQNFSAHTLEEVIRIAHASGARGLFNNAAQAWNHTFFWQSMVPEPSQPGSLLTSAVFLTFGNMDRLRERFISEGAAHFGSGWVWLVAKAGKLEVVSTHDAGNPIVDDETTPLLACDVWEHAYYIDYRQDRPKWLAAWWDTVANWNLAESQFNASLGHGEPWRHPSPVPSAPQLKKE
jgi:superoxide dismutase, Fe-Mn family